MAATRKRSTAQTRQGSQQPTVRIRMYRLGIGDAFLLTFRRNGKPFHILIDCGALLGTPEVAAKLQAVMANVKAVLAEERSGPVARLDVLVLTHAHYDHVSGLIHATEAFRELSIDEVWMGWTENPDDAQARAGAQALARQRAALTAASARLAASPEAGQRSYAAKIDNLLDFFGPRDDTDDFSPGGGDSHRSPGAGDGHGHPRPPSTLGVVKQKSGTTAPASDAPERRVRSTTDAMAFARTGLEPREYRYCEPQDRYPLPCGVTTYVLGPPRAAEFIRRMNGEEGQEMYAVGELGSFFSALAGNAFVEKEVAAAGPGLGAALEVKDARMSHDQAMPFTPEKLIPVDEAFTVDKIFRDQRSPVHDVSRRYSNPDRDLDAWRRIDHDWLLRAGALALNLDNYVNNTSLVLAFELDDSKDVLLFTADAQIGNWRSWANLRWPASGTATRSGADTADRVKTVNDLLHRVIFYKVGHHGSHNATLKQGGLEAMDHPGLVAAIPVDEEFARDKKSWEMPADKLYEALLAKTGGRILRADGVPGALMALGDSNARQAFVARTATDELYLDYFIE